MGFELHMEQLPHSVWMEKDASGAPVFVYIDERKLPGALEFGRTSDWRAVIDAIKTLAVRGAPAIGLAGASALTLWAASAEARWEDLAAVAREISEARPTAVNLRWAVAHAQETLAACAPSSDPQGSLSTDAAATLYDLVKDMEAQDEACNRAIGDHGAELFGPNTRILTHCNAGSLGTAFYGTALGVVYSAAAQGKIAHAYADETRPVGQGARLTTWELAQVGIPVTLICDNMAASLMAAGKIDAVIVGADRIAANGDTANKIGTYGVAVLAKHHDIPFYVAAPLSTFDFSLADGSGIPIEQRAATEVLPAPIAGVDVWNPAFDVTPAELITAIITEHGVFSPDEVRTLGERA